MQQHPRPTRRSRQQRDGVPHDADDLRGIGAQFPSHDGARDAHRQQRDLLVHLVIQLRQRSCQRLQRGQQAAAALFERRGLLVDLTLCCSQARGMAARLRLGEQPLFFRALLVAEAPAAPGRHRGAIDDGCIPGARIRGRRRPHGLSGLHGCMHHQSSFSTHSFTTCATRAGSFATRPRAVAICCS
jgi:hypothetical protein